MAGLDYRICFYMVGENKPTTIATDENQWRILRNKFHDASQNKATDDEMPRFLKIRQTYINRDNVNRVEFYSPEQIRRGEGR